MAKGKKTGGRVAGVANKATTQAREAIAAFVEDNVERLNVWLDRIAEKDPAKAFDCYMGVVEYHIPKLARTELTGLNGGPMQVEVTPNDKKILEHWKGK